MATLTDGPAPDARAAAPAASRRARGLRAALLAAAAAVVALFAWSELAALRDRARADEDPVAVDVEPARRDLTERLLALERTCADLAEAALARTADVADVPELFTTLEALRPLLPAQAGLQVEDRDGRVLAWTGTSVDEAALRELPFPGDGAVLVETPASRRVAVRRTRTTPQAGVPARAVCHLPFEVRYPLRNRFFASWSLAADVREDHRVDAAEVLPPGDPRGVPVASAFGGEFARVEVTALGADAWRETIDAEVAERRAALLAAAALVAAGFAFLATRRLAARGPARAALVRAGLVLALRTGLAFVPLSALLGDDPLASPDRYAHGLPLAFAASPADFLLTCVALLAAAAYVRRAAQAAPRRAAGATAGVLAVLSAALLARLALGALVEDAVRNSRVEFFTDVSVLPLRASAAMFGGLVAAGIAAALGIAAAWTAFAPPAPRRAAHLAALALAVGLVASPVAPWGHEHLGAFAVLGTAGFAVAAATLLLDAGTAARAGLVPLGVAVGVFAPLEEELAASVRRKVEAQAVERVRSVDVTARIVVEETLSGLAESADLAAALRAGRVPPDLQLRLWAESPLASRTGGSAIDVEPLRPDAQRARFSVNLPPLGWLPEAPPIDVVADAPLAGRGPGRDGRWSMGSRRIETDGRAAIVRVTLEVRPPSNPGLPELEILGPASEPDTLRPPAVAVSRYHADGRLDDPGNDAYRAAGATLPRDVLASGADGAWLAPREVAGREFSVFVLREPSEGEPGGWQAFSFDTGGVRRIVLRGARALLFGAVLAILALAATARRWAQGTRHRLAQRLVLSYVLVSGLPLLVLGAASRALAQRSADESAVRELREAVALLASQIEAERGPDGGLRVLEGSRADRDEWLRARAYGAGHHANVFEARVVPVRADLLASSDQGLFDTDLLPRRLPGSAYREIVLLRRPFQRLSARAGDETFEVGYAPLRDDDEVVGALSVPLLQQRRVREADLADGVTAILALYLASLVAGIGAGTWLAARLTRPLRDLETATRRVAAGDLSRPVEGAGPGELGEVVGAFNRMMRDLAESRERLVRAEKEAAWRDMARQVAHEVKNPLTPMRLAAEHLRRAWRDRVDDFESVLERGVDLIVRQTESLKRIATAFSDFARLPGRSREPTDVAAIARRVVTLYQSTPGLTVRADVHPVPTVLADEGELDRVLVNLAKNAVEAMEGRDGTLGVGVRRDGDAIVVTIDDDGPGIPPDVLPRLFEPYFSTKTSGTGLGLAICKRAVEDLGGSITVRSAAGRGTTVTLRLPLATRPPAA